MIEVKILPQQHIDIDINDYDVYVQGGGEGGAGTWQELRNKPFEYIGDNLKVVDKYLTVDTANSVNEDNTKPITASAVYTEIGNIDALLASI